MIAFQLKKHRNLVSAIIKGFDLNIWENKNTLLHLLEYVDFDPSSPHKSNRRDAYITELFFEKNLLSSKPNSVTFGWCCTKYNWSKEQEIHLSRNWYKVVPNFLNWFSKELDRQFINFMLKKNTSQRFFFISPHDEREKKSHFFEIRECILLENNNYTLRKITNRFEFKKLIDIESMNSEVSRLLSMVPPPIEKSFSKKWLADLDISSLIMCLVQRVLMNNGLKKHYPIDIDAIEIQNEVVIFHEFKRKDPCKGKVRKAKKTVNTKLLREIENGLRDTNPESYLNDHKFEQASGINFYGLDISHIGNLEYCNNNNIKYIFTIWDSSNVCKYPRLTDLFIPNKGPKHKPKIVSKTLSLDDFIHFTYTEGRDSGHFTNNTRVQAAIDVLLFK